MASPAVAGPGRAAERHGLRRGTCRWTLHMLHLQPGRRRRAARRCGSPPRGRWRLIVIGVVAWALLEDRRHVEHRDHPAGRSRCCSPRCSRPAVRLAAAGPLPPVAGDRRGAGRRPGRGDRHADPGGQRVHPGRAGAEPEVIRGHPADPGLAEERPAAPLRRPARQLHRGGRSAGSTKHPEVHQRRALHRRHAGRGASPARSWCSSRPSSSCATATRSGGSWSGCCRSPPAGRSTTPDGPSWNDAGRLRPGDRAGRVHRRGRHRHLPGHLRRPVRVPARRAGLPRRVHPDRRCDALRRRWRCWSRSSTAARSPR